MTDSKNMKYSKYSTNQKYAPDFRWLHENKFSGASVKRKEIEQNLIIRRLSPLVKIPDSNEGSIYNIYANDYYSVYPNESAELSTGLKITIPDIFLAIFFDIEGNLSNIINSGFKSEIKIRWLNLTGSIVHIQPKEKIGELIFQKIPETHIQEI